MAKLWGQDVGKVARATVAAGSGEAPTHYGQLSKKCRRLLDLACTRGRVERKGGDGHFDSLVDWGVADGRREANGEGTRLA